MSKICIVVSLLFYNNISIAQSYFEVQRQKWSFHYYKISLIKKSKEKYLGINYPMDWSNSIHSPLIDTMKMIQELLLFEGDERLCSIPITTYSVDGKCSPNLYAGKEKRYSLQVEALFIINQIIFKEPCIWGYMSNPVLQDSQTEKKESIKGDIVNQAYQSYKKWFEVVKTDGLSKTLRKNIFPLTNSTVHWY